MRFRLDRMKGLVALAAMIAVATLGCSSGSTADPTATATATTAPAPTPVPTATAPATATSAPPTATPVPTSTPTPTPLPTATPIPEPEIVPFAELAHRPLPDLLHDASEPLERDEVEALWNEYLDGARFGDENLPEIPVAYFCGDGRGRALNDVGRRSYTTGPDGMLEWRIKTTAAGRWNDVTLYITPVDASQLNPSSQDGSWSLALTVDDTMPMIGHAPPGPAADSPNCA